MMTPIHTAWSVVSWQRYDAEPPELPPQVVTTPDGREWLVSEPLDPQWERVHTRYGAEIHDADRHVTYRATLDPETGDLDYLSVEGRIDDQAARRIPVARIRREVREHAAAQALAAGELVITPRGGLVTEGQRRSSLPPPPLAEVAALARRNGWGRRELAEHYGRPVRTIDGWLAAARKEHMLPPGETGRPPRRKTTTTATTTATTKGRRKP